MWCRYMGTLGLPSAVPLCSRSIQPHRAKSQRFISPCLDRRVTICIDCARVTISRRASGFPKGSSCRSSVGFSVDASRACGDDHKNNTTTCRRGSERDEERRDLSLGLLQVFRSMRTSQSHCHCRPASVLSHANTCNSQAATRFGLDVCACACYVFVVGLLGRLGRSGRDSCQKGPVERT